MLLRRSNGIKGIINSPAGLTILVAILKIKYFQWHVKFHISLLNIAIHLKKVRFSESNWKTKFYKEKVQGKARPFLLSQCRLSSLLEKRMQAFKLKVEFLFSQKDKRILPVKKN